MLGELPARADQAALVVHAKRLLALVRGQAPASGGGRAGRRDPAGRDHGLPGAGRAVAAARPERGPARSTRRAARACHGADGRGDGPAGKGLDPAPTNFHDRERMDRRSVYSLYSTITLGVPGTPMAAFSDLSDDAAVGAGLSRGRAWATPRLLAGGAPRCGSSAVTAVDSPTSRAWRWPPPPRSERAMARTLRRCSRTCAPARTWPPRRAPPPWSQHEAAGRKPTGVSRGASARGTGPRGHELPRRLRARRAEPGCSRPVSARDDRGEMIRYRTMLRERCRRCPPWRRRPDRLAGAAGRGRAARWRRRSRGRPRVRERVRDPAPRRARGGAGGGRHPRPARARPAVGTRCPRSTRAGSSRCCSARSRGRWPPTS